MSYSNQNTEQNDIFDGDTALICWSIRSRTEKDNRTLGFTCSAFDLLHTGHALMLKDAMQQCDVLVVGLQTDPTLNRPDTKNKPVQSFAEREEMLKAIRYIDYIIPYATESDLVKILKALRPDVRVLGTDWQGRDYTGHELPIKIYWHKRDHPWSTTGLRKRVCKAEIIKDPSAWSQLLEDPGELPGNISYGGHGECGIRE